jgi:hypothetical protein
MVNRPFGIKRARGGVSRSVDGKDRPMNTYAKHVLTTAGAALAFTLPAFALAQAQGAAGQPGQATAGSTMGSQGADAQSTAMPSTSSAMPGATSPDSSITSGQGTAAQTAGAPAPGSQMTSGQGAADTGSDASGMKSYPPCSKTVTDSCMQRGGSERSSAHHRMRRHRR